MPEQRRDIDEIITRVRQAIPAVSVDELKVHIPASMMTAFGISRFQRLKTKFRSNPPRDVSVPPRDKRAKLLRRQDRENHRRNGVNDR